MIEVSCPKCLKSFRCEKPQLDIVMKCPHCSADLKIKGRSSAGNNSGGSKPSANEVVDRVVLYEKVNYSLWIAIALYQFFIGYRFGNFFTIAFGIYIICIMINNFRALKNIYVGNYSIIKKYDDLLIWIIIFAVINLLIGGVIGVFLLLFELYIRDYVLKHRYAFEGGWYN